MFPSSVITPSGTGIYECTAGGVALVSGTPANATTSISMSVAYAAEVDTPNLSTGVLNDIEMTLLEAAIAAALGCNTTTTNGRLLRQQAKTLMASSDLLGK